MIDRQTIILMSKLAAYDKYHAPKDRKKAEFFRHDYVYRNNVGNRLFVLLGSFIVIAFYFTHRIVIGNLDILDITGELPIDLLISGIFIVLAQFFYSMLGFLMFSREYNESQERIEEYFSDMNKLSRRQYILEQRLDRRERAKEEPGGRYGDTREYS